MKELAESNRCPWCLGSEVYREYHDREWGVPVRDDRLLFEFLILEGAQAGLSWSTILQRRESYRAAFDNFDAKKNSAIQCTSKGKTSGESGDHSESAEGGRDRGQCKSLPDRPEPVRQLQRLSVAIRGQPAAGESPEEFERGTGTDTRIESHESRFEEAGGSLRGSHDLLCVHAGRGHGERPSGGLFPPSSEPSDGRPACGTFERNEKSKVLHQESKVSISLGCCAAFHSKRP